MNPKYRTVTRVGRKLDVTLDNGSLAYYGSYGGFEPSVGCKVVIDAFRQVKAVMVFDDKRGRSRRWLCSNEIGWNDFGRTPGRSLRATKRSLKRAIANAAKYN